MTKYYVYWYYLDCHTDINTQGYVGITKDLDKRHQAHIRAAKGKHRNSTVIAKALAKYGIDNVQKKVICITTPEHAKYTEKQLRPTANIGWNIQPGGGEYNKSNLKLQGTTRPQEVKDKISRTLREACIESPFKGKTRHSETTKTLIGSYHKGKVISEKHRQAIKDKLTGSDSPKAVKVGLIHKQHQRLMMFKCVREAADALGINYSAMRDAKRRSTKQNKTVLFSKYDYALVHPDDYAKYLKVSE